MKQIKDNRGGKREGAGRKKKEDAARITVSFVCSPSQKKLLDREVQNCGLSRSQYINAAIEFFTNSCREKIP